jgi:hypothetical protein
VVALFDSITLANRPRRPSFSPMLAGVCRSADLARSAAVGRALAGGRLHSAYVREVLVLRALVAGVALGLRGISRAHTCLVLPGPSNVVHVTVPTIGAIVFVGTRTAVEDVAAALRLGARGRRSAVGVAR